MGENPNQKLMVALAQDGRGNGENETGLGITGTLK